MIDTQPEVQSENAEPEKDVAGVPDALPGEDVEGVQPEAKPKHNGGLVAIGLFKLGKAVFFFALGLGALHLVHKNLGDLLLRVATILRFDVEGRLFSVLQDKVDLVSGHQLRQMSTLSVGYSLVALTEGIGLLMEKTWAEYLTLILTTAALPWELFEIFKKPTSVRVGLLVINLAVLAYLVWFVRGKKKREAEAAL